MGLTRRIWKHKRKDAPRDTVVWEPRSQICDLWLLVIAVIVGAITGILVYSSLVLSGPLSRLLELLEPNSTLPRNTGIPTPMVPQPRSMEPVSTVEELRKVFNPTPATPKAYYLQLCQDPVFIEGSAANLFNTLDTNKDGVLSRSEMSEILAVIIRKGAETYGWTFCLSLVMRSQSNKIFNNDILPYSTGRPLGADIFNLKVLIRNALLYASGDGSCPNDKDIRAISRYFYRIRRIDYSMVSPGQIQKSTDAELVRRS